MRRQLGGLEAAGSTSTSFSERLKQNDESAWRQLLDVHGSLVYARYRQAGLAADEAEELTLDVLCNVVGSIARYRHGSFRGWLWTIASRRLTDHRRKATRDRDRAAGGSEAARSLSQLAQRDDWRTREECVLVQEIFIRACELRGWSEAERKCVWDYLAGNLDGQEASRQSGVTPAAFYQRVSRLLRDVRESATLEETP